MSRVAPEWLAQQERRFMRPDARRFVRADAHRYFKAGAAPGIASERKAGFDPQQPRESLDDGPIRTGETTRQARECRLNCLRST